MVQSGGYNAGSPWYLGVLGAGLGCATGLLGVTRVTSSLCIILSSQRPFLLFSHIFSILIIYPLGHLSQGSRPPLHLFSTVKKTCPAVIHEHCDKLQTVQDFFQGNVLLLKQCFAAYFGNLMVHYSPQSVSNDTSWFGRAYPLINFFPSFVS